MSDWWTRLRCRITGCPAPGQDDEHDETARVLARADEVDAALDRMVADRQRSVLATRAEQMRVRRAIRAGDLSAERVGAAIFGQGQGPRQLHDGGRS